jgi:hypothetical protein
MFLQHHVFGCNRLFYSNQLFYWLRYLDVMATKTCGLRLLKQSLQQVGANATVKLVVALNGTYCHNYLCIAIVSILCCDRYVFVATNFNLVAIIHAYGHDEITLSRV